MKFLQGQNILLGVTGGIAAYKSAQLVRLLRGAGALVQVVMTQSAQAFITPMTFQALSGRPVRMDLCSAEAEAAMGHIELAKWADQIIIAPASANTLARLAHGFADDLLSTICLATQAPITVAPAMNQAMWHHRATQENISSLKLGGVVCLGPDRGEQACGDFGLGRMSSPEDILSYLRSKKGTPDATGLTIMITAGPTREAIDPVRFLTNHSSGKMGYALAQAAQERNARVILVSGPVDLPAPFGVDVIKVESADDMAQAVLSNIAGVDLFIGAAAVADYVPTLVSSKKIKKSSKTLMLELKPTLDIIHTVAQGVDRPYMVGFSAETDDLLAYATKKLKKKKLDIIIANQVGHGLGFGVNNNQVCLLTENGILAEWGLMPYH